MVITFVNLLIIVRISFEYRVNENVNGTVVPSDIFKFDGERVNTVQKNDWI